MSSTNPLRGACPVSPQHSMAALICRPIVIGAALLLAVSGPSARAELPGPYLTAVFPPGGQAGATVSVAVEGNSLENLSRLWFGAASIECRPAGDKRFELTIPSDLPPGIYDVRAMTPYGMSAPRSFAVSRLAERLEGETNDTLDSAEVVGLESVVNGRIDKPGDVDCFRFDLPAGQRIVLECWADRIDSPLRAVLEVCDAQGNRLAANRGHAGLDPLIDFVAPVAGSYFVKVFDLTYGGGATYVYRLDVDTGPRVEFAHPCVIRQGESAPVKLFGRNLGGVGQAPGASAGPPLSMDAIITAPLLDGAPATPLYLRSPQLSAGAFGYHPSGSHTSIALCVTDVPVVLDAADNHAAETAQPVEVPCEVSGQLIEADEKDWFAVEARRGEVLWLEAFGERIGSPVDLDLLVLDASGQQELAQFSDCLENLGGYRFPTEHRDPAGRWVAPADGRYLIMVRSLTGGLDADPRRLYRLSVRREEPDFHLAVVSRRQDEPAAWNVWRGGREAVEVIALRRRGLNAPLRITAEGLPPGVECPDIWLGPGADRAPLVVSAGREAAGFAGSIRLVGRADVGGMELVRPASGGTMIWPGLPLPSGRLTDDVCLAIGPEAPARISAATSRSMLSQGEVLDVLIDVEWQTAGHAAALELTGIGLPNSMVNPLVTVPSGSHQGWISFRIPDSLPPGPYTLAVQAGTQAPLAGGGSNVGVTLVSNPITIEVEPARFVVELDPRAPRKISRGQTVQLNYTARRTNGFIGKIHTELVAPGGVVGLRGRGVTFVGQTEGGVIQVIASDDAPLGRQPFLRLEGVGTVEDQPRYRGACFLDLEVVD